MRNILAVVLRTVVVLAAPMAVWALLDRGDGPSADIGGSALGLLVAALVALGWGWYDGHHLPQGLAFLRWGEVAVLIGFALFVTGWVRNGFDLSLLVVAPLVMVMMGMPALVGVAMGSVWRERRARAIQALLS